MTDEAADQIFDNRKYTKIEYISSNAEVLLLFTAYKRVDPAVKLLSPGALAHISTFVNPRMIPQISVQR